MLLPDSSEVIYNIESWWVAPFKVPKEAILQYGINYQKSQIVGNSSQNVIIFG